jgi:hypothetical protein
MSYEEFIETYGDIVVTFSSYYKYCFRYAATLENGNRLTVEIGGDTTDIYRLEVYNNESLTIRDLEPMGGWMSDKDGVSIENFYWD